MPIAKVAIGVPNDLRPELGLNDSPSCREAELYTVAGGVARLAGSVESGFQAAGW